VLHYISENQKPLSLSSAAADAKVRISPRDVFSTDCSRLLEGFSHQNIFLLSLFHLADVSCGCCTLISLMTYRHHGSVVAFLSPPTNIGYDDCLEDKREDYQNCFVLYCGYTTVVPSHMHTDMSSSYSCEVPPPLTSTWPHLNSDVGLEEGEY